jgi:hypothetical protein
MTNNPNTEIDLVGCPECAAPAEVLDRFELSSTDGPVEHVTVACVNRHRFTMAAENLPVVRTAAAGALIGEEPTR